VKSAISVISPDTLVEGRRYLLNVHPEIVPGCALVPVVFYRYDACPATVVVVYGSGQKARVPRSDLYVDPFDSQNVAGLSKQVDAPWNGS
jgi:hypothetical protein